MECATHAGVQTELRCGRCDKPICPRCMIITPGGQRCRQCARLRPPPSYAVSTLMKLRAVAAATVVGGAAGVLWLFLPQIGFFTFLLAAGLGYLMGEAIARVTNRKRGYSLQIIAGFGVLLAYFLRNYLLRGVPILPAADIYGYISVAIAVIVAIGPLR